MSLSQHIIASPLANNSTITVVGQAKLIDAKIKQNGDLKRSLEEIENEAQARVASKNNEIENLTQQKNSLAIELEDKELETDDLRQQVDFYKNLLSQPMHVIAHNNSDFKKAYELQQELLADWMVSQKAFKELAIDLGLDLGRSPESVIAQGKDNEAKVLNNQTKHNNNAEDSNIIKPHIENLKRKLKN